ncbi:hypothetical protein HK405_002004 [Cladochytrium tenue]|nr:hypothetical protein HK405_002004 [Cladochytrium tenue]
MGKFDLRPNEASIELGIRNEFLPRDPTVSEKTPEEFNFALQVEACLDAIRDPAERQIAFECLSVIARLSKNNTDLQIRPGTLDLLRVIREAVHDYWEVWMTNHSPADMTDAGAAATTDTAHAPLPPLVPGTGGGTVPPPLPQASDMKFELNERLARRIFFDAPPDGQGGTTAFLARNAVRICFDVSWADGASHAAADIDGIVVPCTY